MITCIAIDDDPLFLKFLKVYFSSIEEIELLGSYSNPIEGAVAVAKMKPMVLLLDLQMPYLDGLETLEVLDERPEIIVISGSEPGQFRLNFPYVYLYKPHLTKGNLLKETIEGVMKKPST